MIMYRASAGGQALCVVRRALGACRRCRGKAMHLSGRKSQMGRVGMGIPITCPSTCYGSDLPGSPVSPEKGPEHGAPLSSGEATC